MDAFFLQAAVSGIIGGVITGGVALAAIKVHVHYLRRDVDHAHKRIDNIERLQHG